MWPKLLVKENLINKFHCQIRKFEDDKGSMVLELETKFMFENIIISLLLNDVKVVQTFAVITWGTVDTFDMYASGQQFTTES